MRILILGMLFLLMGAIPAIAQHKDTSGKKEAPPAHEAHADTSGEAITYTAEEMKTFVGSYGVRFIEVIDGVLHLGAGKGPKFNLVATSERDVFTIPRGFNEKISFSRDANGKVVSLTKPGRTGKIMTVKKDS